MDLWFDVWRGWMYGMTVDELMNIQRRQTDRQKAGWIDDVWGNR